MSAMTTTTTDSASTDSETSPVDRPAAPEATASLALTGPFSLREVALMGFGHRDERSYDGVMRLAFCVDGSYQRQVGVEVRQDDSQLRLRILGTPASPALDDAATAVVARQVARVLSADQDGAAFAQVCQADPVLARLYALAPGFRPALFYSPYEAAVWSILSARRARPQGIALRARLAHQFGATFDLAGVATAAVPTPSRLLELDSVAGLPADRIPRLHAVAEAAQQGLLSAGGLLALGSDEAQRTLQQLPGIGPFYSTLILVRSCGATDVLPVGESRGREAVRRLYGWDRDPTDAELAELAERWRPFRTWAMVSIRALSGRLEDR
jgi:DNA-3-methyladenine glycosylase II